MRRAGVAAVVAVMALTSSGAWARPAPRACHLVVDPRGDLSRDVVSQTRPGVPSDALDIIGGDVAADTRTITTVIRLAGIPAADAYSPTGYGYSFRFTVNAGDTPPTFEMSAAVGQGSQLFTLSRRDGSTGSTGFGQYIRGVVDETRREVRMSADMSQLQSAAGGALRDPDRRKIAGLVVISGTTVRSGPSRGASWKAEQRGP